MEFLSSIASDLKTCTDTQFYIFLAVLFIIFATPFYLLAYCLCQTAKMGILQEEERETNSNE